MCRLSWPIFSGMRFQPRYHDLARHISDSCRRTALRSADHRLGGDADSGPFVAVAEFAVRHDHVGWRFGSSRRRLVDSRRNRARDAGSSHHGQCPVSIMPVRAIETIARIELLWTKQLVDARRRLAADRFLHRESATNRSAAPGHRHRLGASSLAFRPPQTAAHVSDACIMNPEYPWYWSAAVLAVLFGLSVCILHFRVRSLDRLK